MEQTRERNTYGCGRRMSSRHSVFPAIASPEALNGRDRKTSMRSWPNACVGSRSRSRFRFRSESRPDSAGHGHDDDAPSKRGNIATCKVYCFCAGGGSGRGCKKDRTASGSSRSLSSESGEIRIGTSCDDPPLQRRGTNYAAYRWSRQLTTVGALAAVAALLRAAPAVEAQYKADTPQFEEKMETAEAELIESLEGGDYVEDVFHPERQYEDLNTYVYAYPDSSDYTIGIIVDPCKGNDFDCCHRFYGAPEYPMEIEPDGSTFRAVDKFLFADPTEILSNTAVVDKDGVTVNAANSRFADDEIIIDDNCTAAGVPEGRSCVGYRKKMQRSTDVARCTDNNQTVDAAASCQNLTGSVSEHCVAVGYSQTAMSVVCGGAYAEDPHCGTFLEMHMGYSNSYVDAEEVISEVRLTTENVTGYTTTTIPTAWMNESSQVLCAFEHESLMLGTMVLVSEDAPVCCCPRAFSQKDHLGSLVCPVYDSLEGPFAPSLTTVAEKIAFEENLQTYPFCPALEENEDLMVMSEYSFSWKRFFTRDALAVAWDNATSSYTSEDVAGAYEGTCEYLPQCALATGTTCSGDDREYTFRGRVGKITFVPDDPEDEQYGVTFNDGRTSYYFNMEHLEVEQDYNYEIWWVQRTLHNFRVQARKPLTVTSPTCTFDSTNGQYFPYTMLDEDGVAID